MKFNQSFLYLILILSACSNPRTFDVLLSNGTVIDGTGSAGKAGSIGILDGKMYVLSADEKANAKQHIDVKEMVIAPGFVDVHNHTDWALVNPETNLNEGFIRQGVTTTVGGPDGYLSPSGIQKLKDTLAKHGAGTHVAFYIGHNAIRGEVMQDDFKRDATQEELAQMRSMVKEGMEMGAVGLSTGLMYTPGSYGSTEEVIALAKEVEPFGGIYDSHVRNPVHDLMGSDREVVTIATSANIGGKLGHLKAVGLHNEGKIKEVIALVDSARAAGHNIVADQYPYDGAATSGLSNVFVIPKAMIPADAPKPGNQDFEEKYMAFLKNALADPSKREQIRITSENGEDGGFAWLKATGYTSMRITNSQDFPDLVGTYLSSLAEQEKKKPFDAISDLMLEAEHPVYITLGAIKEQDVKDLLIQPWNMVASDGAYVIPGNKGGHPRSTGTFPRVLGHYVRELKLLSLEEAIRKMTSLPADFIGLPSRGRIADGLPADLVVFDPTRIIDKSTFEQPNEFAEGMIHVLVDGEFVLRDEEITGEKPGTLLKRE